MSYFSTKHIITMKKILLIEDDVAFCKMMNHFLTKNNYAVINAHSAHEARELFNSNFDLILCDIRLPDCDGIELMTEFLSSFPDIPVILMTGYADVTTAVKAMKKGASDYISKPFLPEEVLLVLSNTLEQKKSQTTPTPSVKKNRKNNII